MAKSNSATVKKQNDLAAVQLRSIIESTIDKKFEVIINNNRNSIQSFVNQQIAKFFITMFKSNTINTVSGVAPNFVKEYGQSWMPLNIHYAARKKHKPHFENKGNLKSVFPAYINNKTNTVTRVLGGYNSGRINKKSKGRWTNKGTKTASWSFAVFNNVYLNKLKAEVLLDKFLPATKSAKKDGKPILASTKFGLHKGKITKRYTRPFLYAAIRHFQKNYIEAEIKKRYPITITKGGN